RGRAPGCGDRADLLRIAVHLVPLVQQGLPPFQTLDVHTAVARFPSRTRVSTVDRALLTLDSFDSAAETSLLSALQTVFTASARAEAPSTLPNTDELTSSFDLPAMSVPRSAKSWDAVPSFSRHRASALSCISMDLLSFDRRPGRHRRPAVTPPLRWGGGRSG